MSKNILREPRRSFDIYCASYEFVSMEAKRLLKTQISEKKKANFPVENILWPIFSRSIEDDKCQGTTYKGPQNLFTIFVQVICLFL